MFEPYPISELTPLPYLLREIPDTPKKLYIRGTFPQDKDLIFLSVVGSRNYTTYGKSVCEKLITGLQGYPIVIVSGLALGIDGIAHTSALHASLKTIAIPGSGLLENVLYPATHKKLARDILEAGGALVSEFEPDWRPRPESFPKRNRIMAGLSHAVLVIEAEMRSGTLITSRLATEYNRDVLAVPGLISSATSQGPHMLIQKGAALVQSSSDILDVFGIKPENKQSVALDLHPSETTVYTLLKKEPLLRDVLIQKLEVPISDANVLLSSLELKGYIHEKLGKVHWSIH
jgi:DNA processing protein